MGPNDVCNRLGLRTGVLARFGVTPSSRNSLSNANKERTQIHLPCELYPRAKTFATPREPSLTEVTRRGLGSFLDRFPSTEPARGAWTLPRVDAGGIKVPLETFRDIAADDESTRSLAGR